LRCERIEMVIELEYEFDELNDPMHDDDSAARIRGASKYSPSLRLRPL